MGSEKLRPASIVMHLHLGTHSPAGHECGGEQPLKALSPCHVTKPLLPNALCALNSTLRCVLFAVS